MLSAVTYAVLSDIHGNLEALQAVEAVLQDVPGSIDSCLLLGDLVGYNADPAACLARGLQIASCCIRGNHDKVVAGTASDLDFNPVAQAAARRHRTMLSPAELARLRALPQGPIQAAPGIVLCHGSPHDEDWYLVDADDARAAFQALEALFPEARVCFFGHTHVAAVLRQRRPRRGDRSLRTPVRRRVLQSGASLALEPGSRYLVNPGSVGQPRDGNPAAAFGVFDADRNRYTQYRVAYPVAQAQRKIRALGLPELLASRLATGR